MKHKITELDYIKANRKASREEELSLYGKQITNRTTIHKSKKTYNRQQYKKINKYDRTGIEYLQSRNKMRNIRDYMNDERL